MNKRIVRITALIAMFFVSVALAAVFAVVKPSGAQAEASGATVWGTEIEDCLYRKGEWGEADTTDFEEDSGATANGFEKSYVKTLDARKEISGQLSHASIKAEYTEVRFAIKTVNGRFRVDDFSASDSRVWLKAYDDWAYFVLTRADAGWEIKVYFGDELVHETVNADGKDFVCSILWHQAPNGMIVYPDDSSKEMTVYCTELRAAKEVPLSMVEGASLRIDDEEGGIRFRAKMNEKTASAVINGSAAMNFVIAPKTLFDTVTDGNYANLTKKIEIPVDGTKIYKDGDYYYANGVIANILEANRSLDFCATAYITANGTTTYAEADFSLTRGNLYDIVNQLVVLYGEEYAESILAATPYEWYGKGDYPIVIDTPEQYNALAAQVNGGRDFSAYTAKIAGAVKSATDKTEITKPEFFPQVKETGYDTSAYTDKIMNCTATYDSSNNNGFEATTEVIAPSGFENVFKSVSCSGFDFGHSQLLDGYVKVCFALKSDGKYKHSKSGEIDGNGKWVYFELSRGTSSSHDWKIRLIDEDNNVLFEINRTDTNGFNTLCGVLWHGGDDFSMSGASYVYCTELRGEVDNKYNGNSAKWTPTHWYEASDTEDYLVKNGETEYTVVIPSQSGEFSEHAKTELVIFFSEATGIELNVVQGGSQHTPSGKIISLGDTYSFRTSGLSGDTAYLGRDGARIVTKDKSVYIIGGSERGVLYGVYDFLKIYFGYEAYYKDCYTLDTGVTELKLKDFDVTDIPDISLRARGGVLFNVTDDENDVMFAKRMRTLDDHNDYIFPIYKEFGNEDSAEWSRLHNSSYYIPYETYHSAHPKFFSGNGNQLCYTAHGDPAELEEMIKICAEKAEQSLRYYTPAAHPSMNVIHLGVEDERTNCSCSSCAAVAAAHNGSNAAAIMIFLNAMGEKVVSWMNEEANAQYKRNDLTFSFFVYQNTLTPPFTVNGDGSITVADDLKPSSGVKIRPYAAFSDLTYFKPISDSVNKDELEKVEAWSKFVENGWSWSYGCFFRDYFCFYDLYPFYADYYAELYECGYEYAFAQFHSEQRGADTGFYTLASYLNSKLMWNSSLNMDELIKNYFEAMYGAAATKMYEFYGACRNWFSDTATAQCWDYNSTSDYITSNTNCFTYATVEKFFGLLDEAYAAIDGLKTTDSARYETLKSHIDLEWLFPAKVALTLYQENYDSATLSAMKTKFKSLCEGFGMTKIGESESIDEFINSL